MRSCWLTPLLECSCGQFSRDGKKGERVSIEGLSHCNAWGPISGHWASITFSTLADLLLADLLQLPTLCWQVVEAAAAPC